MAAVSFAQIADMKRQPGLNGLPQPMRAGMEGAMPATSKRQFRFMQTVAHGGAKAPGLSKAEASEYVSGQSPKSLPESAPKKRHRVKFPSPSRGGK
jgi:hypothetical protein